MSPPSVRQRPVGHQIASFRSVMLLLNVTVVGTFTFSYVTSIQRGFVQWPYLFLSEAINHDPARCAGSLGFGIATAALTLLMFARASFVAQFDMEKHIKHAHYVSLKCAKIFVFSLIGVGAVPLDFDGGILHHVFAISFFIFGLAMISLFAHVDRHSLHRGVPPPPLHSFRVFLIGLAIVSNVGYYAFCIPFPALASFFEILAAVVYIFYANTYMHEMGDFIITVGLCEAVEGEEHPGEVAMQMEEGREGLLPSSYSTREPTTEQSGSSFGGAKYAPLDNERSEMWNEQMKTLSAASE